ncbi:MAG: class I SAM-dependent methyltransferase [Acidimicrobiia bacterium]
MTEPDDIGLDEAYAVVTPEDSRRLYARWAETYDTGFVEANEYRYPERVAAIFVEVAGELDGPILDVGCGTGLVGMALADTGHGDAHIDGIDISAQMIDRAARRQRADGSPVYHRLIEADLTQPVELPDGSYAGVVSAGTFTHGHLGPDDLHRLLRLGRPGAIFVVGINSQHYEARGFAARLDSDVRSGAIEDLVLREIPIYAADSPRADDLAMVAVFRRGHASLPAPT